MTDKEQPMPAQITIRRGAAVALGLAALAFGGCGDDPPTDEQAAYNDIKANAQGRQPYIPKNDVEFKNYNKAQELYDSPSTIIWCTAFSENATAPLVTVPIAGKLTSSSTTYFSPDEQVDHGNYSWSVVAARSVDGLFHPNPPQYRYGFTPGGQYVDLFNLPTLCTTQPLEFQRASISVKPDAGLSGATQEAEDALKSGDTDKAQAILEGAAGE